MPAPNPEEELERIESQLESQSPSEVVAFFDQLARLARLRQLEYEQHGSVESTLSNDGKDLPPIPIPPSVPQVAEDISDAIEEHTAYEINLSELKEKWGPPQLVGEDLEPPPIPSPLESADPELPPIPPPIPNNASQIDVSAPSLAGDQEGTDLLPPPLGEEGMPSSPIRQEGGGVLPVPPPPAPNTPDEDILPKDPLTPPAPPALELPEQIVTPQTDSGVELGAQVDVVIEPIQVPDKPIEVQQISEPEFPVLPEPQINLEPPMDVMLEEVPRDDFQEFMDNYRRDQAAWREMQMDNMIRMHEEMAIQMARMYRLHAMMHQQRSYYE